MCNFWLLYSIPNHCGVYSHNDYCLPTSCSAILLDVVSFGFHCGQWITLSWYINHPAIPGLQIVKLPPHLHTFLHFLLAFGIVASGCTNPIVCLLLLLYCRGVRALQATKLLWTYWQTFQECGAPNFNVATYIGCTTHQVLFKPQNFLLNLFSNSLLLIQLLHWVCIHRLLLPLCYPPLFFKTSSGHIHSWHSSSFQLSCAFAVIAYWRECLQILFLHCCKMYKVLFWTKFLMVLVSCASIVKLVRTWSTSGWHLWRMYC